MTPIALLAAIPVAAATPPPPLPLIAQAQVAQASADDAAEAGDSSNSYPYFSLQLGVGFPSDYDGTFPSVSNGNPVIVDTTLDLSTGFNGEAAFGYKFNDFRTDLSVGYGNFSVHDQIYRVPGLGEASVPGVGSVNLWTVMANAYYDIPLKTGDHLMSRWSPYVGAGIGYANISTPACSIQTCYAGGNAGAFAWQAKAGLAYRVSDRGSAFVEGGYLGTVGNTTVDQATFGDFGVWRVNLGWRQGFGGAPSSRPVAAVVEAAPEPEPTPAPSPFYSPEPAPAPAPEPSMPIRGLW